MFFAALCIGLYILLANHWTPDIFGWLWLVAAGWFLGFLDGRFTLQNLWQPDNTATPGVNADSTMPPDEDVIPVVPTR